MPRTARTTVLALSTAAAHLFGASVYVGETWDDPVDEWDVRVKAGKAKTGSAKLKPGQTLVAGMGEVTGGDVSLDFVKVC